MPSVQESASNSCSSTSVLGLDIPKQSAEALGINLDDALAKRLAADLEFRLRDTISLATKFMRHSNRSFLTTQDINMALKTKNVEPMFGFDFSGQIKFRSVPGHKLYYVQSNPIDLDTLINAPLPEISLEPSFSSHWLAIEGVQPLIVQNPLPTEACETSDKDGKPLTKSNAVSLEAANGLTTEREGETMSQELQTFFKLLTEALQSTEEQKVQFALEVLAKDPSLQPLLPFLVQFITVTTAKNLRLLPTLWVMMRSLKALLANPHLFIETYLHQIMPNIVSCIVGKRLCEHPDEDHWSLRDFAAELAAQLCIRYGATYQTLQPRYIKTLLKASLDSSKPVQTVYGAIAGMKAVGGQVTTHFLVKNLPLFDQYLTKIKGSVSDADWKRLSDIVEQLKNEPSHMEM